MQQPLLSKNLVIFLYQTSDIRLYRIHFLARQLNNNKKLRVFFGIRAKGRTTTMVEITAKLRKNDRYGAAGSIWGQVGMIILFVSRICDGGESAHRKKRDRGGRDMTAVAAGRQS